MEDKAVQARQGEAAKVYAALEKSGKTQEMRGFSRACAILAPDLTLKTGQPAKDDPKLDSEGKGKPDQPEDSAADNSLSGVWDVDLSVEQREDLERDYQSYLRQTGQSA